MSDILDEMEEDIDIEELREALERARDDHDDIAYRIKVGK